VDNGAYFLFEDKDLQNRQSHGGFFVHNKKVDENIYLFCMEYDQFWRDIKDRSLSGEMDFKRPLLSPVLFRDLINSKFRNYIDGIAEIINGRVVHVIRF